MFRTLRASATTAPLPVWALAAALLLTGCGGSPDGEGEPEGRRPADPRSAMEEARAELGGTIEETGPMGTAPSPTG
ncbi:hypothetical protein [Streptomyces sp. GC420]|uniref:hypothetical protein n=1 Tax=Streptomyces sp. GC420 TaxID=2697568 RepID=UPI0014152F42|nr:hypothetical protein [Streptomyces sp. GC420]NBM19524.1 hypothetical protein [Streptomyces sp. GC420]